MPTILRAQPDTPPEEQPVLVSLTDNQPYFESRKQADALAAEHGLTVVTMPQLIHAMYVNEDVRRAIRPNWVDVTSAEYHGMRNKDCVYEVWHGVGSLATAEGIEAAPPHIRTYGFVPVDSKEWTRVAKQHPRVSLVDLRKGEVPETPYTVVIQLDQDNPIINTAGQLSYETWMKDDRVLAVCGSPEAREQLGHMLSEEDGGEGRSTVGSYHRINDVGFKGAIGRPVFLDSYFNGLYGLGIIDHDNGRFVGVGAPEVLSARRGAPHPNKATQVYSIDEVLTGRLEDFAPTQLSTLRDVFTSGGYRITKA